MRYHIYKDSEKKQRTTVNLDKILSDLLAIKLGERPETAGGNRAVRGWLQDAIDRVNDPGRSATSQWLQGEVILYLLDKKLSDKYDEWIFSEPRKI